MVDEEFPRAVPTGLTPSNCVGQRSLCSVISQFWRSYLSTLPATPRFIVRIWALNASAKTWSMSNAVIAAAHLTHRL